MSGTNSTIYIILILSPYSLHHHRYSTLTSPSPLYLTPLLVTEPTPNLATHLTRSHAHLSQATRSNCQSYLALRQMSQPPILMALMDLLCWPMILADPRILRKDNTVSNNYPGVHTPGSHLRGAFCTKNRHVRVRCSVVVWCYGVSRPNTHSVVKNTVPPTRKLKDSTKSLVRI